MASTARSRNLEDMNITKEEVDRLGEALKNEEFRKLLAEYAEEINDPKNKKQFQDEMTQLELERGVDCKFINPEPGFVVKTSQNGTLKAFLNICKNDFIQKPSSKPMIQGLNRGLSWSLPFSQAPPRDDYDKSRKHCVVYDVVFHSDALHLANNNPQFKKLVIDTALNAVEENFKVVLDKKNLKYPNIAYKGIAQATVIRKKSTQPAAMTKEEIDEFDEQYGYPYNADVVEKPVMVKDYGGAKVTEKYTKPTFLIKYRSDIDMSEYTYDKNAKLNAAIPKELVVEVNLPLLKSAQDVTLDVTQKSLLLVSENPAKYKLEVQLPYAVNETMGNAKFDQSTRKLTVVLPVKRKEEAVKEDSGVESDFDRGHSCDDDSPVGSVATALQNFTLKEEDSDDKMLMREVDEEFRTKVDSETANRPFLNPDVTYNLANYSINVNDNCLAFVLNVKNVNPESIVQNCNTNSFHVKFFSIGSGYFPIHYAFYLKFDKQFEIDASRSVVDAWDNTTVVQIVLKKANDILTCYEVGVEEATVQKKLLETPIYYTKALETISEIESQTEIKVAILENKIDEVMLELSPQDLSQEERTLEKESDESESSDLVSSNFGAGKSRSISESSGDELGSPLKRKSILKNNRSLSESAADDYLFSTSADTTYSAGSESCILEEEEYKRSKKTVRFCDSIKTQTFRVNSSILGQRKKNQKRNKNKRKALERRASESENSEGEDRERDKMTASGKHEEQQIWINDNGADYGNDQAVISEETDESIEPKEVQVKKGKKFSKKGKQGKRSCNFKNDFIFDLDD